MNSRVKHIVTVEGELSSGYLWIQLCLKMYKQTNKKRCTNKHGYQRERRGPEGIN